MISNKNTDKTAVAASSWEIDMKEMVLEGITYK